MSDRDFLSGHWSQLFFLFCFFVAINDSVWVTSGPLLLIGSWFSTRKFRSHFVEKWIYFFYFGASMDSKNYGYIISFSGNKTKFRLMQSDIKWLLFIQPITLAVIGFNISFHLSWKCFHLFALLTLTICNIEKIVSKLNRDKKKSINMSYALPKKLCEIEENGESFLFDLDFLFRSYQTSISKRIKQNFLFVHNRTHANPLIYIMHSRLECTECILFQNTPW